MAIIYGCTNFSSINYNSLATVDDGSCVVTKTKHHNITGELTKQLLAAGSNASISSISLTNVDSSTTTVDAIVDLYVERQLNGKFYLLKGVSLPVGVTLFHAIIGFNNKEGQFGLYIKLTKSASETPAVDEILS